MNAHRYFAAESPAALERARLGFLCDIADPVTARRLAHLGIRRGWCRLEVAAGAGGVARWMAQRVGPRGHVVTTDRQIRLVSGYERPNLEVRRHDILEDELKTARYNPVHCRMLLQHLADPLRALERMTAALRPGGWLLIEESDWNSYGAADPDHPTAADFDRRSRAIFDHMRAARVLDPYFGRRVPGLVERLGLTDVGHEGPTGVQSVSVQECSRCQFRVQSVSVHISKGVQSVSVHISKSAVGVSSECSRCQFIFPSEKRCDRG
jgi:SAM-dependent methyltransferase